MSEWEYATIYYGQEADFSTGQLMWTCQIKWPGSMRLEIRDRVQIADVLNELGADGWELVSNVPGPGLNGHDYTLKRSKPDVHSEAPKPGG